MIMLYYEKLNNINYKQFEKLNILRLSFNPINEDFCMYYNSSPPIKRFLMKRQVKLLKVDNTYIGFIWTSKEDSKVYRICSLFISETYSSYMSYIDKDMTKIAKKNSYIYYSAIRNSDNDNILGKLGFSVEDKIIELEKNIKQKELLIIPEPLSLELFVKGRHEELRCRLQNNIFTDNKRKAITLDDIYFDVSQKYFFNEGSIFLKYNDTYIGYGQIMIEDNMPYIVNFGIVKEYRFKGYGRLLLSKLIDILYEHNYDKVKIKVNASNKIAHGLYVDIGFNQVCEHIKWYKNI
jgi:ribosomal protein S18 acetylase RimI-like enzyme